jgi:single-strand DNA-binding protein
MLNCVILIGRLCSDPRLSYTPSGKPTARITLAVDRGRKDANGKNEADFIRCSFWDKQAELVANYLQKGRKVAVEGRLRIDESEQQDGTRKQYVEVVCSHVEFLDKPKSDTNGDTDAPWDK